MLVGNINIDGMEVGVIEINLSSEVMQLPEFEARPPSSHEEPQEFRNQHHFPGHHHTDPKPSQNQHHFPGHQHHPEPKHHHWPGHHQNKGEGSYEGGAVEGVDPRIQEIVGAAARHLPKGYKVRMTSGYRGAHEPNHSGHAADYQIIDPQGNALPNRGNDPTGKYQELARHAYGEMQARHPELKGHFAWGGAFGTQRGSGGGPRDLMHFDINGERGRYSNYQMGNMGQMPGEKYGKEFSTPQVTPHDGSISNKTTPGSPVRGSWFDDRSTATGLSAATTPGIALPSREGLGKMHEVTGPSGQKVMLPQIDVGPAKWTGRGIDISKGALDKFGYTPKNFPTDANFKYNRVGHNTEAAKPPEDL